ncbi:MAG: 4-hydroxy-tetrahydrodipicolinate reductase [Bacteroidota bacterium]
MKITLLGYGKMGRAIEQEALARGHEIAFRIDKENLADWEQVNPTNTEVVIEFTHPDSFQANLQRVIAINIPMVTGTTGWHEEIEGVRSALAAQKGTLIYSANFSVGVNLLFKLNQRLAELMNPHAQYDAYVEERHHRYKADGPSGTAYSLAQQIVAGLDRKSSIVSTELQNRPPSEEELSVGFIRSGEIIGYHKVSYTSDIDSLSIEHSAHNRRGFALGAVIAAENILGKEGLIEFSDIL